MRKNKKQRRVMFLLILILSITIGFALLSTTLFINGTANIKSNTWNIHWDSDSIEETTGSVTATTPAAVTDAEEKNISFAVEFELPGDFYEFSADAVNEGSIDGKIENISIKFYEADGTTEIDKDDLPEEITYSLTHKDGSAISENEVIAHGGTISYKFRIGYNSETTTLPTEPIVVKPDIEITPVQHKEKGIKYDLGDLVYFDPVSEDTCNSSTFDLNAVNNGTSTCYKWRVITPDDTESKTDIKIQLDHNVFNRSASWTKTSSAPTFINDGSIFDETKNAAGPSGALDILSQYTSSWIRLPLLNYTYDTSNGTCHYTDGDDNTKCQYGVLSCVNGTCKISKNNQEKELTTGLRTRLITAEEVAEITNTVALEDALSQTWTIANNCYNNGIYYFTGYRKIGTADSDSEANTTLGWLIENSRYTNPGTGETTNIYVLPPEMQALGSDGYWTLTPTSGSDHFAWFISNSGGLEYNLRIDGYGNGVGVRPVTELNKTMITKE